jgi:hypothetical protein
VELGASLIVSVHIGNNRTNRSRLYGTCLPWQPEYSEMTLEYFFSALIIEQTEAMIRVAFSNIIFKICQKRFFCTQLTLQSE